MNYTKKQDQMIIRQSSAQGSIIILFLFLITCKNIYETNDKKLSANAGSDQITIVGSYVLLDATKSVGPIDWYQWEQNVQNPAKVILFSGNDQVDPKIGFIAPGIYKFSLTVKSGSLCSEPDEVNVEVNTNPFKSFEDPNLEIIVRMALARRVEELTESTLSNLDSLKFIPTPNRISSLKGIERCSNLADIEMGLQDLSDISPLMTLNKIKRLSLDQNYRIFNIAPLSGLTELEWLNLSENRITDIFPLKNLVNLKYLNLSSNRIVDISVLENMRELRELYLFDASIHDLSALSNLKNLERLWLTRCDIEDISSLNQLVNIKNLKLAWNRIHDIASLSFMEKLEWVALEKNEIYDISSFSNLHNVKYVRLWDNKIVNIKPLVDNSTIGKGDIIGLEGNPLDEISVKKYIPTLQARGVIITK